MARFELSIREHMSDWKFWVGVAYLGLILTVVALVVLFNRTAREEASRAASGKAAATTQVGQCFTSVKTAPVLKGFIDAHESIIQNSLLGNEAALKASPKDDPLRGIRVRSIVRLNAAQKNVDELRKLITAGTPTEKKCVALAASLGVDASRYVKPAH